MLTLRHSIPLMLALLCACQVPPGSNGYELDPSELGHGRVHLGIHDDPLVVEGHVISSIIVTVEQVELRGPNGWNQIDVESQVIDILELQGGLVAWLGAANVPVGHYDQIRMVISEARAIVDGQEVPLTIPSAYTSGIKIATEMQVDANQALWVQLDFDLDDSVHRTGDGKWMMKPVIKLDDLVTKDDVVAVALVQDGSPTELSLPDGAHVVIEDGAVPDGTVVSLERIVDQPSGMNASPVYEVLPSGPLAGTAIVTLPYELPQGLMAQDLEMSVDRRFVSAVVDEGASTISATLDHFCELTSSPNRDVLLAHTRVRRPNDAVKVWADLECSSPWIAAQVDLSADGVFINAHTGGVVDTSPIQYGAMTLEELTPDTVDFAINTVEFGGVLQFTPSRTTRIGGENYYIEPEHEGKLNRRVELLIHEQNGQHTASIMPSEPPHGEAWLSPETLEIAFGSLASVAWHGEYKDSNEQPIVSEAQHKDYRTADSWTMAGVSADGTKLLFMVLERVNLPMIYNHADTIFDTSLNRALLFDGGGSATAVMDGFTVLPESGAETIFAGLSATTDCSPMEFVDVLEGEWFRPYVQILMCAGIIDNGEFFHPGDPITRAEFLKVTLETAFPNKVFAGVADKDFDDFTDVHYQAWYAPYVEFAESENVVDGYMINGKLYFKPDQPVTRAEAAKMLVVVGKMAESERYKKIYKFYDNLGAVALADRFNDVPLGHWAYEFIHALRLFDGADPGAQRDGIVCGHKDPVTKMLTNEFHPDEELKRSEMSQVICIAAGYCAPTTCG